MGLLQLLTRLFGKSYLNKIMGTRTNVAKPIRMDKDSPFKEYSDSAFDNPEVLAYIEKKIDEYGPYALNNKNAQELANFESNAQRLLAAKNKQAGTTPGMVESMKPRPKAEIIDIGTGKKIDDEGIMTLKERAPQIDTNKSKGDAFMDMTKASAKPLSLEREAQVRTASREFLNRELKLGKIKLNPNETKSILQPSGGGTDPIDILRTYYGEDVLEALDDLAPKFMQTEKYSDYLKIIDENLDESFFKPRNDPSIKQSYTDDEMIDIVNKQEDDLGDKLKNLPDDIDPDALANGGRPGYAYGTGLKLLNLFGKQKTNAAKEVKRSIDNIFPTGDAKYDADVVVDEIMEHLDIDRDAVDGFDISDLYGKAYDALTKQRFDAKKLMESVNQKGKGAVTTADNIPQPTKTLKSIKDTGTIDISNDEIMGEFEAFMRRNDPEGMKPIDALVEKINLKGKKRTDNAEGGRIGFSGGTKKQIGMVGFQKLRELIRNLAKQKGVEGSDILKLMNYKNMQPDIKSRFTKAEFDKFKLEIQKSKIEQLENFKDMFESKVKFNKSIEQGKALDDRGSGMSDIFSYMDESFSKGSPVPRNINEEDVLKMDQLIKNQTVKDDPRKLNAQGGLNYLMGL